MVATIGFARRRLNVDAPLRGYLTQVVFPLYIVHQTVIVVLTQWSRPWALPAALEMGLLIVANFALGLMVYELVCRVH